MIAYHNNRLGDQTLLPVPSLGALEQEFRDRTKKENREFEFITDGIVYVVTSMGDYFGVNNGFEEIEKFMRLRRCLEAWVYHTHPHLNEDGTEEMHQILPPSFPDFRSSALLNDDCLTNPRIKTRVIEKYGVWEYSMRRLPRCSQSDQYFYNYPIAMKIKEIKDLPIEEQVSEMLKFYKEDDSKTVSFRRI